MRILCAAPRVFLDSATNSPKFGSYAGPLPRVELGATRLRSLLRRKKWAWLAITTDEVWLSLAVVRMGYASSAFAFLFDLRSGRMIVDRTVVAPPFAAQVSDDPHVTGELARFGLGATRIRLERRGTTLDVRARLTNIDLKATLDESDAPPPISAIAALSDGDTAISATEKRALTAVRGAIIAAGQRFVLDDGLGGYDYTHGLMPRHTRWKWAFAMGRTAKGEPIAFNVVEGFVGEPECAFFRRASGKSTVLPLKEPHFDFDADHPTRPWTLTGEGIDLTFDVGAVHAQHTNIGVARSRFLQPVGVFRGTIRIDGEEITLDRVPGVVEDQDVLW